LDEKDKNQDSNLPSLGKDLNELNPYSLSASTMVLNIFKKKNF
jgi:hypothetical protein